MSDYGSVEDIKRKIADGTYKLFTKDGTSSNVLWTRFEGIAVVDDAGDRTELPFVSCLRCKKLLTYDKVKGGTSHLRRHADNCNAKGLTSSSTPSIDNYFKSCSVPLAAKQYVTEKCVDFVCGDIRPFETIAGDGFIAMAQAFIGIGVKYGQASAKDVIPHPTTVSRKISDIATKLKETVV
jgi:hypothetical protein